MKLTPHIIQIGGIFGTGVWGANVYLLVGDKLALVDTGFKGRTNQILKIVKEQEVNSIKRLANLGFDIICFGHGAAIA